jgi:hypothetical protein
MCAFNTEQQVLQHVQVVLRPKRQAPWQRRRVPAKISVMCHEEQVGESRIPLCYPSGILEPPVVNGATDGLSRAPIGGDECAPELQTGGQ